MVRRSISVHNFGAICVNDVCLCATMALGEKRETESVSKKSAPGSSGFVGDGLWFLPVDGGTRAKCPARVGLLETTGAQAGATQMLRSVRWRKQAPGSLWRRLLKKVD